MAKKISYDQPGVNELSPELWNSHIVPALRAIDALANKVPGASPEAQYKVKALVAMAKAGLTPANSGEAKKLEAEVGGTETALFLRKSIILARACVKRIGQPEGAKRASREDDEEEEEEEDE